MPTSKSSSRKTSRRGSLPKWVLWTSVGLIVVIAAVIYFAGRGWQKATQTSTPTAAIPAEISVDEAFILFGSKNVLFLDVRPAVYWKAYHIDQSVSIPSGELFARFSELPHTGVIVIVDGTGDLSPQVQSILQKSGFPSVTRMTGGIDAWVQRGYPIIGTAPF